MVPLTIESLADDNVDELVEMFATVDATHFAHSTPESAHRFLREASDVHVLGRAAGRVVAFGMLRGWEEGYAVPSLGIAVASDVQGRGYGKAMMTALANLARQRPANRIRLRVHRDNVRARRLYASCG